MAVAYLVLAHRDPEQVARLVRRLGEADETVFVHIDQKVDIRPFAAAFDRLERPPVCLEDRVPCHWGAFGHTEATLRGMRLALESDATFTHLVLVTGQDYPLRSATEISGFLARDPSRSYLSWSLGEDREVSDDERAERAQWFWDGDLIRLLRWHVRVRSRLLALPPIKNPALLRRIRRIPGGLQPAQGLAYWNLSREAVAYCLAYLDERPEVMRFFRRVLIPDENIFQMILLASPLAPTLVNDDLRHVRWEGWHPRVLRVGDIQAMLGSGKLFARKFDRTVDDRVLDDLDAAASTADV